ncbi:MAG: hypothetical protein QM676_10475 [Novosphingobium sp.]
MAESPWGSSAADNHGGMIRLLCVSPGFRVALVLITLAFSGNSYSQEMDRIPDPETVKVPELDSIDPRSLKTNEKFFYFHSSSRTFAEAYVDIRECRSFLPKTATRLLPSFIPWTEPDLRPQAEPSPRFGLVGVVIGAILFGGLERNERNIKMRRCMEPRGYARVPLTEVGWKAINEGEESRVVAVQAKLAGRPADKPLEAGQ